MKRLFSIFCFLLSIIYLGAQTKTPVDGYPRFALGADVSWTTYIEKNNVHKYFTSLGAETTVPEMVSDHGLDAIRLRVWVNPNSAKAKAGFKFAVSGATYDVMSTYGTCSAEEIAALAYRFACRGQRIMLAFHLSDQWADPARQFIPSDWVDCTTVDHLSAKAVAHVHEVLTSMLSLNINVTWVQIGNETNTGMMKWNVPSVSGGTVQTAAHGCEIANGAATNRNFVRVFSDVARAAREVYPEVKTVLHLANADNWSGIDWTLKQLKQAGLTTEVCDYVGLSLYPGLNDGRDEYTAEWQKSTDLAITAINNIHRYYGMRTLLCEVGMNNEWSESISAGDQASNIAQCSRDVSAFTQYLIDKLDTESSTCDGLFYWEPETDYMMGYKKGACVAKNPSTSWPRDNVVANGWWRTIKGHSTFPLGGLKDYTAGVVSPMRFDDSSLSAIGVDGRIKTSLSGLIVKDGKVLFVY